MYVKQELCPLLKEWYKEIMLSFFPQYFTYCCWAWQGKNSSGSCRVWKKVKITDIFMALFSLRCSRFISHSYCVKRHMVQPLNISHVGHKIHGSKYQFNNYFHFHPCYLSSLFTTSLIWQTPVLFVSRVNKGP